MSKEIEVGSVVRLKGSEGPRMTVGKIYTSLGKMGVVDLLWFHGDVLFRADDVGIEAVEVVVEVVE